MDVSESHPEASLAVDPTLVDLVRPASPVCAPVRVMLKKPVPPALARSITLRSGITEDSALVDEPTARPAVMEVCRLLCSAPAEAKHAIDVSEYQALAKPLLAPARIESDIPASPMPVPCSVTLNEPVAALFAGSMTLVPPMLLENPVLLLRTRSPTVTSMLPLLVCACEA